ncbi:hypothetical protein AKJ16_DCAP12504 [Drosera capensis]
MSGSHKYNHVRNIYTVRFQYLLATLLVSVIIISLSLYTHIDSSQPATNQETPPQKKLHLKMQSSLIMEPPKPESAIDNHFSHLHLSQTDPSQVPFSTSNPMKRPFSSITTTDDDTAPAAPLHLPGFNVLQLPSDSISPRREKAVVNSGTQLPPLWRSASDPTPFPLGTLINSPTQAIEAAKNVGSGMRSVSRSMDKSDVTGFDSPGFIRNLGFDAGGSFRGSGVSSSKSRSSGSSERGAEIAGNDSPAAKRLRRMSVRMREMKQWFDEVLSEDGDEQGPLYQAANMSAQKSGSQFCCTGDDDVTEAGKDHGHEQKQVVEDALVSAERDGDSIVVHFRCPCGSGYHILLSGQSCYYKLL